MTNRKNDNWIIYLIVVIALIILFWHFHKSSSDKENSDKNNERLKRISELENEKRLLIDDRNKVIDLEQKIHEQSEKLWKKMIRIIIGLFILFNIIGYLIFKSFSLENLLTWYGVTVLIINVPYFFFTFRLFSIKEFLFEHLKDFSYKIVAGNKNALYFQSRLETVQNRIDLIDFELKQLQHIENG